MQHLAHTIAVPEGKKVYFASDFHLGAPNGQASRERERLIVQWLEQVGQDAAHIFLIGDLFDFWFEYKRVVPKGFVRLQGKLAELSDAGMPITIYTGNHDMWMFGYLEEELGVAVLRKPQSYQIGSHSFFIGHGDGLGPGDRTYKLLKLVFESSFFQALFRLVPPQIGMGIAHAWSRHSRHSNNVKETPKETITAPTDPKSEWLWLYSQEIEAKAHHDFYVFGHRHKPLELPLNDKSLYLNTGEWISQFTYGRYDGSDLKLLQFENAL